MSTKTSYTNELKNIKDFSNLHLKTFFEFIHIFGSVFGPLQVDMNDSHFLPLDIASTFFITTVVCCFYEEVT